jgi:tetratricopeptide (TPR) repeat protein
MEVMLLGNLARSRVDLGDYPAGEADLRRLIPRAEASAWFALPDLYVALANALLGMGQVDEAVGAARRALELGQQKEAREYIGGAWRALGRIGAKVLDGSLPVGEPGAEIRDPGACFASSEQNFAEVGAEKERARTLRDWAYYERKHGDPERAQALWQQAREIFTRLGMNLELRRMEEGAG